MTIENNPALGLTNAVTTAGGSTPTPSDRFVPGAIIAGRYRLVAMLGRGGMGEVYRADDLTLDQPVALKFLPVDVAADAARLSAFHNELRVARQVSHKNVCRLHDLGEADGRRVVLVRLIARRTWLSALVSALLLSMPFLNEAGTTTTNLVFLFVLASGAVLTFVVFRSGLLALAVALLLDILARNIPIMPSMSHWAAGPGNWTLALLVGVACFGYYASRGGQPLFGTILKG